MLSARSLTALGIHSTPTNKYFSIKSSGFDYLDGSYTRMLTFSGSNITPVQFQIEVHNGTNSTSSNASLIGNITNNDLRFGVNNPTSMILTTTGRLGLGYIACTAMAMTSDRRLKKNIQIAPLKRVKRLYDNCDVFLYDWIESEDRSGPKGRPHSSRPCLSPLTDLISVFYRDDIQEGEDRLNLPKRNLTLITVGLLQHENDSTYFESN
ncbi:unnamed protein product [Phytophthora lilii]|uniref:Unnamed protein product n=1 Tax=Phytophthora lilii TaxID=2077276 RepID=A0A9W6U3Y7_9STRA|nr:unnamed protein product [Phytophthora lilii]